MFSLLGIKFNSSHHWTWIQSLGWRDPLEEGVATRSSILAWRIPWTEEPGGLQSMGSQRVRHDWVTEHITEVNETVNFSGFMAYFFNIHFDFIFDGIYALQMLPCYFSKWPLRLYYDFLVFRWGNWGPQKPSDLPEGACLWSQKLKPAVSLLDNPLTWSVSLSCLFSSLKAWSLYLSFWDNQEVFFSTCKHIFREYHHTFSCSIPLDNLPGHKHRENLFC